MRYAIRHIKQYAYYTAPITGVIFSTCGGYYSRLSASIADPATVSYTRTLFTLSSSTLNTLLGPILNIAASSGDIASVKQALDRGEDIESTIQGGLTPLHLAAYQRHTEIVRYLLHRGADHDARTVEGYTPLHLAANQGYTDAIIYLLYYGAAHDARTAKGYVPLHLAASQGHIEAVMLLTRDLDPDIPTADGWTALHIATKYGHKEVVDLLLLRGAHVHAKNNKGDTPLCWAVKQRPVDIIDLLIQAGARVNDPYEKGNTVLLMASRQPYSYAVLYTLLKHKADPTITNQDGQTVLHKLASRGSTKALNLVLDPILRREAAIRQLGNPIPFLTARQRDGPVAARDGSLVAYLNTQDRKGKTALHKAAEQGNVDFCRRLLRAGADRTIVDNRGRTACKIAWQQSHIKTYLLLLQGR